jgi:hypothetical protein
MFAHLDALRNAGQQNQNTQPQQLVNTDCKHVGDLALDERRAMVEALKAEVKSEKH